MTVNSAIAGGAIGQLYNPAATSSFEYCPLSNAEQFLAASNISPSERWRDFGDWLGVDNV